MEIETIFAKAIYSEEQLKKLKGLYVDDDSYDILIDGDCDVFDSETKEVVLKYRKNQISQDLKDVAWTNCRHLAKSSRGRGAAAGPINPEEVYWKKRDIYWSKKWSAKYMVADKINGGTKESSMKVNNEVASNPMGFYGETKSLGLDLPCRLSHYTKTHMDNYESAKPFFQRMGDLYQELLPEKYNEQKERAEINEFHIEGTPFSTVTINRNFRTGLHQDSGDFGGWAAMSVLEEGQYHGGLLVFPKYRIALDLRQGDFLIANVHEYHCNTELFESISDKIYNDTHPSSFKDNLKVGILGLNNRYSRLSFVCYLRADIIKCAKEEHVMTKYFISLKDCLERQKLFKNTDFKMIEAVDGRKMGFDQPECQKMVSFHNIRNTDQHLCKVGCFLSHFNLLIDIVNNKTNNVLIVEDDAQAVRDIPDISFFPKDSITYLGGFILNRKITKRDKIIIDHKDGLNELDTDKYRMMMTMAYYIPTWEIAKEIIDTLKNLKRWRAIDICLSNSRNKIYYHYPAIFIEAPFKSTIRPNKKQFSKENYKN